MMSAEPSHAHFLCLFDRDHPIDENQRRKGPSMTSRARLQCYLPILICGSLLCTGCTSVQLRKSTVVHSMTLSDIYTQQVLNNLAKFIQDPNSLPFFSFPNQGTTAIQDTGNVGGPGYTATNFVTSPFGISANRQATENWVLVPVSDPAKLALMRCAYQQALSSCIGIDLVSMSACPDCKQLRRDFYGAKERKAEGSPESEELACLNSSCWLQWGCKSDVPKDCQCPYVGNCGDSYVWVRSEGRDMLTSLTLTILDYAVNDPSQFSKRTKTVELYLDNSGRIVGENSVKAIKKITATIPIDQPAEAVAILDTYSEFLRRYGAEMAVELQNRAKQLNAKDRDIKSLAYWQKLILDEFVKGLPEESAVRLRDAARFVQEHNIIPGQAPKDDELLRGPALYERKGAASSGLQALGERLKAVSPSSK
jgi:hypothetical protein